MKVLEENVEQSLLREEEALQLDEDARFTGASDDIASLQKTLKDMKAKYEVSFSGLLIILEIPTTNISTG